MDLNIGLKRRRERPFPWLSAETSAAPGRAFGICDPGALRLIEKDLKTCFDPERERSGWGPAPLLLSLAGPVI
jgi:hypothetical protein